MDGFGINGRFWDQLVLFVHWDHGVVRVRMLQATKQALEQATVLIMRYLGIERPLGICSVRYSGGPRYLSGVGGFGVNGLLWDQFLALDWHPETMDGFGTSGGHRGQWLDSEMMDGTGNQRTVLVFMDGFGTNGQFWGSIGSLENH
jgi:hypothetical protein